jgi:hypothetical protein
MPIQRIGVESILRIETKPILRIGIGGRACACFEALKAKRL